MDHGIVGHNMHVAGKLTPSLEPGARRSSSSRRSPTSTTGRWATSRWSGWSGTVDIHFGMLGHGAFFGGGDRDIALTRSVMGGKTLTDEGFEWNLPEHDAAYYRLPAYANDVQGLRGTT